MSARRCWVVPELTASGVRPASWQVIAAARELCDAAGWSLHAALLGVEVAALIPGLHAAGVDEVSLIEAPLLAEREEAVLAQAVRACLVGQEPEAVILADTPLGRGVAGFLAAWLPASLVTGCAELHYEDGLIRAWRETGGPRAQVVSQGVPTLFTLRAGRPVPTYSPRPEVPATVLAPELAARTLLREAEEHPGMAVGEAPVVVVGGMGLGTAANFLLLERLATLLGGAVGATRAVVRAGWRPYREQIGLTGALVAPRLVVAAGVHGASEHLAGYGREARWLVLDRDPGTPAMRRADWALTGDVLELLPRLLDAMSTP